jgi:hypothetical protein
VKVMGFWKSVGYSGLSCSFGGIFEQLAEVGEATGCCMALLLLLLLDHKGFAEATH